LIAEAASPRRLRFDLHTDVQVVMRKVKDIREFLLEAGCNGSSAQQLALAAEEVFVNIASNAWPDGVPGQCRVEVTVITEQGRTHVSLQTEDDGVPFDPLTAPLPDLDAALEDRPMGGLGIFLVKTMTDSQTYRRVGDRNVLLLAKNCAHEDG
jgi:serine/threonine-protein kinase RsbW